MNREQFSERFQSLSVKERIGIVLAIGTVIYALWDFFLMQPITAREKLLQSNIEQKNNEMMSLSDQMQTLANNEENKKNELNRQRLESVIKQLEITDQKLVEVTANLIAPEQMADVLETLLLKTQGLTVRRLHGLGAAPFPEITQKPEDDTDQKKAQDVKLDMPQAWRHGMRLEFSGSYLDTLAYLKALEALDWKFYWESIELEVDKYPNVNTAIKVYTLSLDKDWIGV